MKILLVIPYFYPAQAYGGPICTVYELSKELLKKGHEIFVLTTDAYSNKKRIDLDDSIKNVDGIKVFYVKNLSNYLAYHHRIFFPYNSDRILKKYIHNFDIIHMHKYLTYQNMITYKYCKENKIPYILQPRGVFPNIMKNKVSQKLFDKLIGMKILNDCNKIIALTYSEKNHLISRGIDKDKIIVIPNGINLSNYNKLPEKGEFRNKYSIENYERIILFVGRINKIKGLDFLVKTFANLSEEIGKIKLVIVGPDDGFLSVLKRQVKKLKIGDKVLFTGPIYGQDKLQAYVDADVFVLPSIYESFGTVVLEAMACGIPALFTNKCGIADFIDKKVGYEVKYGTNQLKESIYDILINDRLQRKLGEECKKFVHQQFDLRRISSDTEKVYLSLTEK